MNINYNEYLQLTGRTAEFYKKFTYFSTKTTLFSGIRFFVGNKINRETNTFHWKKHWADIGYSMEPWEVGQLLGGN